MLDEPLVRRRLLALDQALQQLGRHAGRRVEALCEEYLGAHPTEPTADEQARLVHAGTIRVRGRAPDALVWELPAPPAGGRLHL